MPPRLLQNGNRPLSAHVNDVNDANDVNDVNDANDVNDGNDPNDMSSGNNERKEPTFKKNSNANDEIKITF